MSGGARWRHQGLLARARIRGRQSVPLHSRMDPGLMSGNPNRSKGFTWGAARERSEESLSVSVFPHVKEKVCLIFPIMTSDEMLHLKCLCTNKNYYFVSFYRSEALVFSTRGSSATYQAHVCWFLLANLSEFLNDEISLLNMSKIKDMRRSCRFRYWKHAFHAFYARKTNVLWFSFRG